MTITSVSFFDAQGQEEALLPLQVNPSEPAPSGLSRASSMVLADRVLASRLAHFPANLYDLRETSHLVRFLKAILGESGVGQLRKRYTVAHFQTALQSSHFYDLDGFYGAIFGLSRFTREALPIDPYVENATEVEWDQIQGRDAAYRSRITRLASAINLGATLPGIKAAAEAIVEVEVDVYETWRLQDTYATVGETAGNTWDDIEAMGTWDDIEGDPWDLLSDSFLLGRTGANLRSEVIVRPRKDYNDLAIRYGDTEALRQRAEDSNALVRVLSVLKPAGVLITVDLSGLSPLTEVQVASLSSPSNYWDVVSQVAQNPNLPLGTVYPLSHTQVADGVEAGALRSIPKPPWSSQPEGEWSYAPEVVTVSAYSFQADGVGEPGDAALVQGSNEERIDYSNGQVEQFQASRALMDANRALAARYSSDGVLVAHPFSSTRVAAVLHG